MFRCWKKWILLGVSLTSLLIVVWIVLSFNGKTTRSKWQDRHKDHHIKSKVEELQTTRFDVVTDSTYRIVHLDLKGAPPRLSYLRQVLSLIAEQGGDGIMLEYEDMFPYSGKLANLSAKNSYNKTEIKTLLSWAHDLNLEVIPLIQTFGHLEFALKLDEFRHLREDDKFPQAVCPSMDKSYQLIEEMIDQVMAFHPGSKFIHIGCDEVYQMNTCYKCASRMLNSSEMYTQHVLKVSQMVKHKLPGIRVLIWDDMMRHWKPDYLFKNPLTKVVEPVVWVYGDMIGSLLPHFVWFWYGKSFPNVWIASAYKGADEPIAVLPDMAKRYTNHVSWLSYVRTTDIKIAGIVLTGWSRFDHFAVLCELLPAAIPSLILSLMRVSRKHLSVDDKTLFNDWSMAMECSVTETFLEEDPDDLIHSLRSCHFPGSKGYRVLTDYLSYKKEINSLITSISQEGRVSRYNFLHNYTNTLHIFSTERTVKQALFRIRQIRNDTSSKFMEYFDNYTINEWIEQKIAPIENEVKELSDAIDSQRSRRVWSRRPV